MIDDGRPLVQVSRITIKYTTRLIFLSSWGRDFGRFCQQHGYGETAQALRNFLKEKGEQNTCLLAFCFIVFIKR